MTNTMTATIEIVKALLLSPPSAGVAASYTVLDSDEGRKKLTATIEAAITR
jgi:hypothetical protein